MTYFDVFNGDADGICALVQLRLAEPRETHLVTGVKRNIKLLQNLAAGQGDTVTVLDVSMQKNREDLQRILNNGAQVFYADHHHPGELIQHANLSAHIDRAPTTCTALIVDDYLKRQFHHWAITAAYGDNLMAVADKLSDEAKLTHAQRDDLKKLGVALNYNGYGISVEDLFFHPAELYRHCVQFQSPFEFIEQKGDVFDTLHEGYQQDMSMALAQKLIHSSDYLSVVELPAEKWAWRVSGVLGNELVSQSPQKAHLILSRTLSGSYTVSLRSPLNQLHGADEIASSFPTGGGRKSAAGINELSQDRLGELIQKMEVYYGAG